MLNKKKIPVMKKIWICKNCDARVKALTGLIEKPKQCPNCNGQDFI